MFSKRGCRCEVALAIGLDAQIESRAELLLEPEQPVIGALRAREYRDAVRGRQFVDALGLNEAPPAGAQTRESFSRYSALARGLQCSSLSTSVESIPAQAAFERERRRDFGAHRRVGAVLVAVEVDSRCRCASCSST